jgi:hypothetical protein
MVNIKVIKWWRLHRLVMKFPFVLLALNDTHRNFPFFVDGLRGLRCCHAMHNCEVTMVHQPFGGTTFHSNRFSDDANPIQLRNRIN